MVFYLWVHTRRPQTLLRKTTHDTPSWLNPRVLDLVEKKPLFFCEFRLKSAADVKMTFYQRSGWLSKAEMFAN